MVIQSSYARHQTAGFYGDISRPVPQCIFDLGITSVPVKPGDGVLYDSTADKWKLPTTDAEQLEVSGIVCFDSAVKANSDGVIEFAADALIKVGVMGHFFAKAGEALEYGDLVVYDQTDKDWVKYTRTIAAYSGTVDADGVTTYVSDAIDTLPKAPAVAVSKAASGGLVELRFSGAVTR